MDGAGFLKTFTKIMLPLSKSAMASSAILTFIFSWNEFMYAMLLTSSEKNRTLPLTIKVFYIDIQLQLFINVCGACNVYPAYSDRLCDPAGADCREYGRRLRQGMRDMF